MKWNIKIIILILSIFILQSCTVTRCPNDYPLIVTGIQQTSESGYDIYFIKDTDPRIEGWGIMYIKLKDKRGKFKMGDTIVFSKKHLD